MTGEAQKYGDFMAAKSRFHDNHNCSTLPNYLGHSKTCKANHCPCFKKLQEIQNYLREQKKYAQCYICKCCFETYFHESQEHNISNLLKSSSNIGEDKILLRKEHVLKLKRNELEIIPSIENDPYVIHKVNEKINFPTIETLLPQAIGLNVSTRAIARDEYLINNFSENKKTNLSGTQVTRISKSTSPDFLASGNFKVKLKPVTRKTSIYKSVPQTIATEIKSQGNLRSKSKAAKTTSAKIIKPEVKLSKSQLNSSNAYKTYKYNYVKNNNMLLQADQTTGKYVKISTENRNVAIKRKPFQINKQKTQNNKIISNKMKISKNENHLENLENYKPLLQIDVNNILVKGPKKGFENKTDILRESLINLDTEKILASFDDRTKKNQVESLIIDGCDIRQYRKKVERKYEYFASEDESISTEIKTEDKKQSTETEEKLCQRLQLPGTRASSPGRFKYALSNRKFIEMGWTCLPVLKFMRQLTVYRMNRESSENDWFRRNTSSSVYYNTGECLGDVDHKGNGKWFYKSGNVAFTKGKKCVIYSDASIKSSNHSPHNKNGPTLAWFDDLGNGVIYDFKGNVRLQYNQVDGSIKDRNLNPPNNWKWFVTKEEPKIIEVFNEKYMNKERKFNKVIINSDVLEKLKCEQNVPHPALKFRMKVFKLSDNFAIRIIDQSHIFVCFSEGSVNLRHNVGMIIDRNHVLGVVAVDFTLGSTIMI